MLVLIKPPVSHAKMFVFLELIMIKVQLNMASTWCLIQPKIVLKFKVDLLPQLLNPHNPLKRIVQSNQYDPYNPRMEYLPTCG